MSTSAPPAFVNGHCPSCGPDRIADVVGHHQSRYDDDESGVWGETDCRILQCRGCRSVYFQQDSIFSEEVDYSTDPHTGEDQPYLPRKITYWPEPPTVSGRMKPSWSTFDLIIIDNDLASLFDDIYVALNNNLAVLSAIGIRTVFDRASELLGVDPGKNFAEKLSELVQLGKIGADERNTLDILTDAGSAAAHRGWKPKPTELDTMMGIIEAFLYRTFILDAAAKRLKQNVPAKQKKKKT
jgi:hypothetical protein